MNDLDKGLCMNGNGAAFERALNIAIESHIPPFTYLEIGLGRGDTFNAVHDFLSRRLDRPFHMIGCDLPDYGQDLTDRLRQACNGLIYRQHSEVFFRSFDMPLNFAFIDGNHGYKGVTSDFLAVEKLLKPGGVAALHDCGEPEQDKDDGHPSHNPGGIRVRKACMDLGLIPRTRPGWKLIEETNPYDLVPPDGYCKGRACLFVQKI